MSTGTIPIYSAPNGTQVTTNTLGVGSQVKITAQAESNGKTYYEIGTNEWVDASFRL
ncbi:SLAP domain-containing protein [Lactobacillus jensenii]|uniref:SLAP domain-containing protein n=1 Tax=Lactobacillus jensenii TaxID=109790 RepID=UPI00336AB434